MFLARYNPWMGAVQAMANSIGPDRTPLPDDYPHIKEEREAMERIGASIGAMRVVRDQTIAALFEALYAPTARPIGPEKE